ncbi:PTS system N-acetylglucosamine-specific IIB component, Glc family (TC 4.A.1.1.7)/PTS system N-acetylglucosamine-specific IIC component, Glc family (TC 4.A.1.1.7) [Caminicella sporogenes DSM 14501]|uniref:PTS system N-acetylglucosamine-specific IIB component, Glc family (TC 4.A.1.1.7)/PTS system N-acetylglucosamine-specific IIC component, Glc family (TC 4.A.1.1.7) n=1 Tax=Caminicella sporogenes DSM 14501 TaxID=1121266 RepID=A0A1M6NZV8_9FIRM|nr:N-acetylglucosamine-specific PTS transporter subunit IIBC [Caminicella sporogenes]SHK01194.1 PTS system N-acetylglucosamine-specific IIB component, Glc family (TC 4.A.1.1.7)/PTS system N-acetylglucosamine-specific IIC component, Glc family (TC 4.A.1.1.7) [Caminicella sporogenes DSM 14501]
MKKSFGKIQKIGKALMLPVAVLPAAGLLLRLGAPDVFNIPFIMKAGDAIFSNLALLFAIGVAVGLAFDNAGAAGLAGAVGYLVLTNAVVTINKDINMSVLAGIISGIVAGVMYNKFHDIKLPDWLGFFGGKRFVPIITATISVLLALIFGYIWPPIQSGIHATGEWIIKAGVLGVFAFGFLNRLLIPVGLHHVMNSFVWFVFGEYNGKTGDLSRFFAGDPTAGSFMAGFFPIFMFALPAAAFAMIKMAKKENRKAIAGAMISVALTSFLTGITEPVEFIFMFLAPVLYITHAILTGVSMAVVYMLGIKHGFTFSAGAIDYFLNMGLSTKGWLIIPIGIVFGIIYYIVFVYAIKKLDLPTPGRMDDEGDLTAGNMENKELSNIAVAYIEKLGGIDNLEEIDACITRLRLTLKDNSIVDDNELKKLGASGVIRPNSKNIQVVVGTKAEIIADAMKKHIKKIKNEA